MVPNINWVASFAFAARLLINDGISEKADGTIDVPGERVSRAVDVNGEERELENWYLPMRGRSRQNNQV